MYSTVLGQLLLFEAFLLLLSLGVGYIYHEDMLTVFGLPIVISLLLSILFQWIGHGYRNRISQSDGFLIVSSTWILYSIIGMLPFLIGGYSERLSCALFEAMSGFTTTGASTFTDIDSLPHAINFWRCLTHWIGGMGIVFFTVAILPNMGSGEFKLFSAESVGLKIGKLHPRIKTTAHWIGGLYFVLTLACAISYYFAGMNIFDATCHSFSTLGTGGFSTHQDSIGFFQSPAIEYVCIIFMMLAATNFSMLYLAIFKGGLKNAWHDEEIRWFYASLLTIALLATLLLHFHNGVPLSDAFRRGLFHVTSIEATAGFTLEDFTQWHPAVWCFAIFLVCQGGTSGSTAGGMKAVRIVSIWKVVKNELNHMLHPHAMLPTRINHQSLKSDIVRKIFVMVICYLFLAFIATAIFSMAGVPVIDGFSCACSALSGVGPGFGTLVSPVDSWSKLPDIALYGYSFLMLAGRLEIFSVIILFFPSFWKNN